jgi:site-specific DNA-methyltransferase (adenine-specific)
MQFMADVPDKYYDLAIVDPPYGIERFKKASGSTRFKSSVLMQEEGLTWDKKPTDNYFNELFRISKNQIIWGANNFILPPTEYFCIWNKKQTVDNFASAEYAWVSMGLKAPARVFDYSIHLHNHTDKIHPTQKPVALYEWLLSKYAKPNDKIIDTHGGSGSIAIAVDKANTLDKTNYLLDIIELDKDYFDASLNRFKQYKSQTTLNLT